MNRKDYVSIADALKSHKPIGNEDVLEHWKSVVVAIAHVLGGDNDRFDYQGFYKACGKDE